MAEQEQRMSFHDWIMSDNADEFFANISTKYQLRMLLAKYDASQKEGDEFRRDLSSQANDAHADWEKENELLESDEETARTSLGPRDGTG